MEGERYRKKKPNSEREWEGGKENYRESHTEGKEEGVGGVRESCCLYCLKTNESVLARLTEEILHLSLLHNSRALPYEHVCLRGKG